MMNQIDVIAAVARKIVTEDNHVLVKREGRWLAAPLAGNYDTPRDELFIREPNRLPRKFLTAEEAYLACQQFERDKAIFGNE